MKYLAYTIVSAASLALLGIAILVLSDWATGPYEAPPDYGDVKEACEIREGRWNEVRDQCECARDGVLDPEYDKGEIERCSKLFPQRKYPPL